MILSVTIYIDDPSIKPLLVWAEKNKWRTINALPFYEKTKVIYSQAPNIEGIFKKNKMGYKFNVRENKRQFAKGKILVDDEGKHDFGIHFSIDNELELRMTEDMFDIIKERIHFLCNMFLTANAYLWYGNLADEKNLIAQGKNLAGDKIIVFRPYKETLYAMPVGKHRSPEGVFEVRGHFRKYKSGKIVWIDGYLKGLNNEE